MNVLYVIAATSRLAVLVSGLLKIAKALLTSPGVHEVVVALSAEVVGLRAEFASSIFELVLVLSADGTSLLVVARNLKLVHHERLVVLGVKRSTLLVKGLHWPVITTVAEHR